MNRSPLVRTLLASAALAAAVALAGCEKDGEMLSGRSLKPISEKLLTEIAQKNMTKESPILVRIFKQEAELEVWKQDSNGQFALLKTFPICRWSGDLGPKIKEGDRQAPEGFYTITPGQMNPASQYYLAFNMGYPNAFDQANGRSGAHLMVHGDCSSRGCYAMTDEQIAEIYALARESFFGGQRSFQIQAYPFHMTPANMAKHRNNPNMPFWKMLKEGSDHFEVTRQEPKVDVCERRYVFNAGPPANATTTPNFSPRGQCPVYQIPDEVVAAVAEKKQRDEIATAELISRGAPVAPTKLATDGGMNPVFMAALEGRPIKGTDGEVIGYATVAAPGTIPPTVNPPTPVAAPVAVAVAPVQPPAAAVRPSNAGIVRTAATAPAATPPASRSVLGSLFASDNSDTKSSPGILDRAARAIGLRGSDTATADASAPPAPKPAAPATKPAPVATAAAQPKPQPQPAAKQPAEPPTRIANAGAIMPASKPTEQKNAEQKSAEVKTAASGSLLSGAAPVIPAGSFGAGWSALR